MADDDEFNEADFPVREGWVLQRHSKTFSGHAGPFYIREEGKIAGMGFYAKAHHANMAGIVHGGAMLTLADMALWDICRREIGMFMGVTVSLNSEFVGAGPVGGFIEASGEMVKAGGKLLFARGIVSCEGATLLNFSGILRKIDKDRIPKALPKDQ